MPVSPVIISALPCSIPIIMLQRLLPLFLLSKLLKYTAMKRNLLLIMLIVCFLNASAQKITSYNGEITQIEGTEFMVIQNHTKEKKVVLKKNQARYLIFVNTLSGDTTRMDFGRDVDQISCSRIQIDSLGIDKILVFSSEKNSKNEKIIGWKEYTDCYVCSLDGKYRVKINRKDYIIDKWIINDHTGTIITNGYDLEERKNTDHRRDILMLFSIKDMKLIREL